MFLFRVCMKVFSTLMSWSNKNKICMRVDDKREFVSKFSQLSCSSQTRTRVARELMRVDCKGKWVWNESSYL